MKKLMLVILGVLMIASLAACTGGTDDKKTSNTPTKGTDSKSPADNSSSSNEQALYLGTIQSIAGNEIELALAKIPEELKPGAAGERNNGKENGNGVSGEGENYVGGITDIPEGKDRSDTAPDQVEGDKKSLASMLEYTGENKSFVIPAGVQLTNMTGGSANISDLNKMNVLMITVNKKDNAVISCEILE